MNKDTQRELHRLEEELLAAEASERDTRRKTTLDPDDDEEFTRMLQAALLAGPEEPDPFGDPRQLDIPEDEQAFRKLADAILHDDPESDWDEEEETIQVDFPVGPAVLALVLAACVIAVGTWLIYRLTGGAL